MLAKHRDLVEEMRKKVDKEKRDKVVKYEEDNAATIKTKDLFFILNFSCTRDPDLNKCIFYLHFFKKL